MDPHPWDADMMLKRYIYDYLIRRNLHATAQAFRSEVDTPLGPVVIDDSEGGFLLEWWQIFTDMYFSKVSHPLPDLAPLEQLPFSISKAPMEQPVVQPAVHPMVQPSLQPLVQSQSQRAVERGSVSRDALQPTLSQRRGINRAMQRPPPLNIGSSSGVSGRLLRPKEESTLQLPFGIVDERWAGQPDYIRRMHQDFQGTSIWRNDASNSANNFLGNFQNAGLQRMQQMDFKRPKMVDPICPQLYRPPKMNVPVMGLPEQVQSRPPTGPAPDAWLPNPFGNMDKQTLGQLFLQPSQAPQYQLLNHQEQQQMLPQTVPVSMLGNNGQLSNNYFDQMLLANARVGINIGDTRKVDAGSSLQLGSFNQVDVGMPIKEITVEMIPQLQLGVLQHKDQPKGKQVMAEITGKRKEPSYPESENNIPVKHIAGSSNTNPQSPGNTPYFPSLQAPLSETFEYGQGRDFFGADKNRKLSEGTKSLDDLIDLNDVALEDRVDDLLFPDGEKKEKNENAAPSSDSKQSPTEEPPHTSPVEGCPDLDKSSEEENKCASVKGDEGLELKAKETEA